jgi:quinolinate synthase
LKKCLFDGKIKAQIDPEDKMNTIKEQILKLKAEKKAVILAHYYQTMDIQEIADIVGDSFELAKKAKSTDADIIVLCGVRFMAESAKILNPEKRVLLPVLDAGCPMADMVTPEDVRALKTRYPGAAVVCYINSSAAVKAESDICCTSSSAEKVVRSLSEKQIIFIPDQNLGAYIASKVPEKEFILYDGYCPIHHKVTAADVIKVKEACPEAQLLIHPECRPDVLEYADLVGSTSQILDYAIKSDAREFVIGTEIGVVERLKMLCPSKIFYLLAPGFICPNMKKTGLADVLAVLEQETNEINMSAEEIAGAEQSLKRMIAVG